MLDSKVSVLKCNQFFCMCITVNGSLYLWRYNHNKLESSNKFCQLSIENEEKLDQHLDTMIGGVSCYSILKERTFQKALLTEQGVPVIYLSDNRSFFYSVDSKCWHLVPVLGNLVGDDPQLLCSSKSFLSSNDALANKSTELQPPIGPLKLIQSREKSTR